MQATDYNHTHTRTHIDIIIQLYMTSIIQLTIIKQLK